MGTSRRPSGGPTGTAEEAGQGPTGGSIGNFITDQKRSSAGWGDKITVLVVVRAGGESFVKWENRSTKDGIARPQNDARRCNERCKFLRIDFPTLSFFWSGEREGNGVVRREGKKADTGTFSKKVQVTLGLIISSSEKNQRNHVGGAGGVAGACGLKNRFR